MSEQRSFFIKYRDYKTGMRYEVGEHTIRSEHNVLSKPEDEKFDGSFASLQQLQQRLKELYPDLPYSLANDGKTTYGDEQLLRILQNLLLTSERYIRKYPAARRKRREGAKATLLNMSVSDFFTKERLIACGATPPIATRARGIVMYSIRKWVGKGENRRAVIVVKNMHQFLKRYPDADTLELNLHGLTAKTLPVIKKALDELWFPSSNY